jgi:hypothetical protein
MTSAPDSDDDLASRIARTALLQDAPETVIQKAILLFERPLAAPRPARSGLRQVLEAVLRFDSAVGSAQAFGLRNDADATRQLLFFCEGRDVDIRITPQQTPNGRRWRLSGQVLGPDAQGTAELRTGAGDLRTPWDSLCEFSFEDVPEGSCVLVLTGEGWTAALPPFDIPA